MARLVRLVGRLWRLAHGALLRQLVVCLGVRFPRLLVACPRWAGLASRRVVVCRLLVVQWAVRPMLASHLWAVVRLWVALRNRLFLARRPFAAEVQKARLWKLCGARRQRGYLFLSS